MRKIIFFFFLLQLFLLSSCASQQVMTDTQEPEPTAEGVTETATENPSETVTENATLDYDSKYLDSYDFPILMEDTQYYKLYSSEGLGAFYYSVYSLNGMEMDCGILSWRGCSFQMVEPTVLEMRVPNMGMVYKVRYYNLETGEISPFFTMARGYKDGLAAYCCYGDFKGLVIEDVFDSANYRYFVPDERFTTLSVYDVEFSEDLKQISVYFFDYDGENDFKTVTVSIP